MKDLVSFVNVQIDVQRILKALKHQMPVHTAVRPHRHICLCHFSNR